MVTPDQHPLFRIGKKSEEEGANLATGGDVSGLALQAGETGSGIRIKYSDGTHERSAKALKRQRQAANKSSTEMFEAKAKKKRLEYAGYLRTAIGCYVKMPEGYYGSDQGVWEPPKEREWFPEDHQFKLKPALNQPTSLVALREAHERDQQRLQAVRDTSTAFGESYAKYSGSTALSGSCSATAGWTPRRRPFGQSRGTVCRFLWRRPFGQCRGNSDRRRRPFGQSRRGG